MIKETAKHLKIAYIKDNYEAFIKEALDLNDSYEQFLEKILTGELENRKTNRIQTLIRASKLPTRATFDDYLVGHLDKNLQKQVIELKHLRFIDKQENVILIGNPGVGKTFLANTLGMDGSLFGWKECPLCEHP